MLIQCFGCAIVSRCWLVLPCLLSGLHRFCLNWCVCGQVATYAQAWRFLKLFASARISQAWGFGSDFPAPCIKWVPFDLNI